MSAPPPLPVPLKMQAVFMRGITFHKASLFWAQCCGWWTMHSLHEWADKGIMRWEDWERIINEQESEPRARLHITGLYAHALLHAILFKSGRTETLSHTHHTPHITHRAVYLGDLLHQQHICSVCNFLWEQKGQMLRGYLASIYDGASVESHLHQQFSAWSFGKRKHRHYCHSGKEFTLMRNLNKAVWHIFWNWNSAVK